MVGFYTAQPGSVTLEEQGTDAIPTSAWDVQSAAAGMALAANPTPRIVRATLGGGLDTELRPAVDPRTAGSDVDAMAAERGAAPVMLSPEDANARYGIKGALSFDKPVPEPVASALHDTKHNQIVRQDVIDRRTPGIITGWAGRGVTSLAMGLLDPVNLAAGLVPGFGEARIAGALGLDIAGSVAARTGVRALAGASGGAAGMAALEPVNYLLDQHEHNDWTMGEALRNVAFGAVLGGALHTGIGALGDRLSRPPREVVEAGQETQAMAMRGAVAQVAEGRPVGVADAIDLAGSLPEGYRESVPLEPSGTPRAHPYLPENEPRRLVTFIQREGGIRDPGGDVLAMLGRHQDRPGLINQNGHTLDDMALRAWENGFFPEAGENRPDINALLDAMGEDLAGNARYSHLDEVAASNYREAQAHNAEVARISFETGIPDTNLTREQFWDAVANHLSAEEVAKEISSLETGHAAAFEEAERAAKEWIAHHGTPHDFDRFDTSKIGTGEGNQAYGHGLYFAENKGVADSYRTKLSDQNDPRHALDVFLSNQFGRNNRVYPNSIEADLRNHSDATIRGLADNPDAVRDIKAIIEGTQPDGTYSPRATEAFSRLDTLLDEAPRGHLYTVRIKAKPEEMLDWDKPLSEQSPKVRQALLTLGVPDRPHVMGEQAYGHIAGNALQEREMLQKMFRDRAANGDNREFPEDHERLAELANPSGAAAQTLHAAGIKGIRYLDRDSRTPDVEVLFDGKPWRRDPNEPEPENADSLARALNQIESNGGNIDEAIADLDAFGNLGAASWLKMNRDRIKVNVEKQTHNVVVFDHVDVEITHKNGEAVEPHAPSAAEAREIGEPTPPGADMERVYGPSRSLEELEHEFRQEQAAGPARSGEGGDGESRSASGYPETLQDGLRQERGASGAPGRGDAPGGIEPTAGASGSDGSPTAAAQRSLGQLRDAAGRPTGYPDAEVTARENAATVERAPKVEDKPDADIQEAQRIADETTATIQAEIAAGRLTEEHLAPLREAEARFADEEAIARAMEEAAMCMRLS